MGYQVRIVHEPGRNLAVTRFEARVDEMGSKQGQAFGTVMGYLSGKGIEPAGPAVSHYEMRGDHFDVASGFVVADPVDGDGTVVPLRLPTAEVATTTHVGPYEALGEAYAALRAGAREQGREVDESGPMWEEYWSDPDAPPEQTKTVVFWPVRP